MPSSAEPAHPEPSAAPPGKILHLAQRTPRGGHGRRTPHSQPTEEPAAAGTPQQRLAETAEAWFIARGMTLTDPAVAATYRATLDLVRLMHDGSHAQGAIGDDELHHLAGMVDGLHTAPDAL